ncbi:competence/damage-inducible domain protein CinA [Aeromicrobium marinum DSM 15272]|uniref:Competence/damage-inducible domain protein CinA n=1 Tax=Aeromicrobium marinum DSM 15272 TaxID=585531 RepID=E2SEH2_9ACTN|nr:CinA family protein [Aeromicrobium marinum]EFQ82449.1 competence/damage-inducible domain protein CinA [Aeromicrobium marinum DSM 15272]
MSATRDARGLIGLLADRGLTVATAESLTGGLVCAELVGVAGASAVVRGGVVAYASRLKLDLLGVDPGLLGTRGAIDPDVAAQMAAGVRGRCGADVGIATTGNAGPTAAEGREVGLVYVAVADARGVVVERLDLAGDRDTIRRATVDAALSCAVDRVGEQERPGGC